MLSINAPSPTPKNLTPNLLPCAIKHNGPINASKRYWSPTTTTTSTDTTDSNDTSTTTSTSYFRGRKLQGRPVTLPSGYTGVILQKSNKALPSSLKPPSAEALRRMEEDGDELGMGAGGSVDEPLEVKTLNTTAVFDGMMVWEHEGVAREEGEDVYVRGVKEWIGLAEAVSPVLH